MPIRPPNLDDRRYADIVREARALIPQYCPEWTNLGDADPGITLVQLFAWMTEMIIYRLNRVPDKTYIHFLNFIGEERRKAVPAQVPLTFELKLPETVSLELPAFARCSTRQTEGVDALHYVTSQEVTIHDCNVARMVSVHAAPKPMVREITFDVHPECAKALLFGGGAGVQVFRMDPIDHGSRAYTPFQYLYVSHDDFRLMNLKGDNIKAGRMRIRTASSENLPIGALFRWEYYTGDGETPWAEIELEEEEEEVLGLPELSVTTLLPGLKECDHFGAEDDAFPIPEVLAEEKFWIRGVIDYERWLAHRMSEDLEVTWRDDRGGEERLLSNWEVRDTGRNLEFFIQDMPPIRGGWTVRFTLVDRSMPAGRGAYLPRYRFTYRRGDLWEVIPAERVRYQDTSVILTGPLTDMASDGYNLRAERVETVFVRGFVPELALEMTWLRPVELSLGFGPETGAASQIPTWELPCLPFQPAPTLPPLLGMKFFIGSDLFENRAQKPVMIELEVGFELDAEAFEEPKDLYRLQFCYRAADTWRVVYDPDGSYNSFTFADLDPEGALEPFKRKIRITLDPKTQLKGLHRSVIAQRETTWLRIEVTKASLTHQKDKKSPILPISLKFHSVKLGYDGILGKEFYEQPMPAPKMATVEYRKENRRLSRAVTRAAGRLGEHFPFDTFIDIVDDSPEKAEREQGHNALYIKLDKPLPEGQRHSFLFRTRGESYLPRGMRCDWEILEDGGHGRLRWSRLIGAGEDGGTEGYMLHKTGTLEFPYPEPVDVPEVGPWLRALFRVPHGEEMPALPPLSHLMLNTVEAVNLHAFRMEKFSGLGVPHQPVQLRHFPLYLHDEEASHSEFPHPDRFPDIRVYVFEEDGERREWRKAPGNSILTASKDDRVFTVDAVEGILTFGNGIRGKMLPAGNYNLVVEIYHTVPGEPGNVRAGAVCLPQGYADVAIVANVLPAVGGRNAESIDEIIRRAPSILTSRDRAVTRLDFEIIAKEGSAEVARAACDGRMSGDGEISVIVLPKRMEGEKIPDPFLSGGLKDHVQRYLQRRCLVNVRPVVRLATFKEVDVAVEVRLRPNANVIQVREQAKAWINFFLDAYTGGLDGEGWPFSGTLYSQDFGRMVKFIPEVRHVSAVHLYGVPEGREGAYPGWERGQGVQTIVLDERDLFVLRRCRVVAEEDDA